MKSVVSILVLIVACVRFASAAKCSDHILSLKADFFSEDDGGIYGNIVITSITVF